MANVYKNVQAPITPAGSYHPMYESPTATSSIVKTIKLYNTHGSNLAVDVKVYDASSATDFEYDTITVNASNSVDLLTFNNVLILEAGDIIKMQCASGNVIKMTASLLQISRPTEVTIT
jgi:hypothetical protein|tara:strand:+ start:165 stop:521 length:357 start_codon:yes stop_codon:yes gene_type:complete